MIIKSQDRKMLLNTDNICCFEYVRTSNTSVDESNTEHIYTYNVEAYLPTGRVVIIGAYNLEHRAEETIGEIAEFIASGLKLYIMPKE